MCSTVCNPVDGKYQKIVIEIDRGPGGMAKANTTAQVHCATIAIANQSPNAACGGMQRRFVADSAHRSLNPSTRVAPTSI
jgi:hypothetical protein